MVILVFQAQYCLSQNIIWERRYSWIYFDQLTDVVAADPGQYLAVGISQRLGIQLPTRSFYGLALVKFDEFGDTSFVKHLGGYLTNSYTYMCRGDSGIIYVVTKLAFTSSNVVVLKLDYEGNIIDEFIVPDNGTGPFDPADIIYSKKKEILIIGPDQSARGDSMRVVKLNSIGLVIQNRNYSGGGTTTWGNYIEEASNGTYLASGTTSSNIWAVELDSNGNQLRQGLLYRNSGNLLFTNAAVKAAPSNRYICFGTFASGSILNYYFGSHDGLTNRRIWGGEKQGSGLPPQILNTGQLITYDGTQTFGFSKLDDDSSRIWRIEFGNSRLGSNSILLKAFSYNPDSSVIAVGYLNYNSPTNQDFYIARISGVGVPYDPTTPVATRPQLGSRGGISIWPQPASHANGGTLHFGGFAGPATLALYNMKGQQVFPVPGTTSTTATATLLPRQPVPIGHLPPGLYVYRLVARDRVWMGKVVISE